MKFHLFAAVVVVASTLALNAPAGAAPGDLDPTFGSAGSVSLSPVGTTPVTASSVTLQADGGIVITTNGVRDAIPAWSMSGLPLDSTASVRGATAQRALGTSG